MAVQSNRKTGDYIQEPSHHESIAMTTNQSKVPDTSYAFLFSQTDRNMAAYDKRTAKQKKNLHTFSVHQDTDFDSDEPKQS